MAKQCVMRLGLLAALLMCFFVAPSVARGQVVYAWGNNSYGQLGNGTTTNSSFPIPVSGLTGIIAIAGGSGQFDVTGHSLALMSNGTVWGWGENLYGELGDGTNTNRSTPVKVNGLGSVTAIAAGDAHSLALLTDGTVWAWGDNYYGELGDGTGADSTTPVQVAGLADVKVIACGQYHSLAILQDGTVWAWGYNVDGELGDGTTTNRFTPVQVNGLTGATAIAGGSMFSLAIITPTNQAPASLKVSLTSVTGGKSATGTVTLSAAAPAEGAVVSLTSSNTAAATVPASVTVAAGSQTATFTISTNQVAVNTNLTISAAYAGVTKAAKLTVKAPTMTGFSVKPSKVKGGVGTSVLTITLNANAPAGGLPIALVSSDPTVLPLSGTTVPEGTNSVQVTLAPNAVTTSEGITITGTLNADSKKTTLTVTP